MPQTLRRAQLVPRGLVHRWQARPAPLVAGLAAAALSVWYLLRPLSGTDLSAQLARADFARHHPSALVDLRWFGGSLPFGYSLWAPLAMAYVGVRLTGAICCVVATVQTAVLFERANVKRPLAGAVLAAGTQAVNLNAGRITFSVGMVCGLGALLSLSGSKRRLRTTPRQRAGALAFLAAAASPVAALYLWLCAGALMLSARRRDGLVLLIAGGVPLTITSGLFGDGGDETFTRHDAYTAVLASGLVLVAVFARHRTLRWGALLAIAMVGVAYFLDTPVGNNAARLSLIFAVPLIAACAPWRSWTTAAVVVLTAFLQRDPLLQPTATAASAHAAYYRPLLAEIRSLGPLTGRVEIPETMFHWDDWYVARAMPLARGWIRQVDVDLTGPLFFRKRPPDPSRYAAFLDRNAVQFVAVPDTKLTDPGRDEVATIDRSARYLRRIWSNENWTLYAVRAPAPVVGAPGRLIAASSTSVTLWAPGRAEVDLRIRWFRWLSLRSSPAGACVRRTADGRTRLRTETAGVVTVSSSLVPSGHC